SVLPGQRRLLGHGNGAAFRLPAVRVRTSGWGEAHLQVAGSIHRHILCSPIAPPYPARIGPWRYAVRAFQLPAAAVVPEADARVEVGVCDAAVGGYVRVPFGRAATLEVAHLAWQRLARIDAGCGIGTDEAQP